MPPPSAGGATVLEILGILERFDLGALQPDSVAAVHLFTEAGRLAYADRDAYIADPDFVANPLAGLLDPEYLASRAKLIDLAHSMGHALPGTPAGTQALGVAEPLELPSTTHISIVDSEGNAVAMTASIEAAFGNRQMVRGFLLNNELTDFDFVPGGANQVQAGKRPRSSMAPTMVFDAGGRELVLAIGSPGGPFIINFVARALVARLDWGLDLQAALDAPNFGSRNGPTEIERGTAYEALAPELRARGHEVVLRPMASGLHAVERAADGWRGAADSRREGVVLGN
jgi:gamma-glutamyltranspeptidase/glutathione hydrolase